MCRNSAHNRDMDIKQHDHGIVTRQAVLRLVGARSLENAINSGELLRVDRGRFALRGTAGPILAAARARGSLTCLSALRLWGVWTIEDSLIHVSRSRGVRDRHALSAGLSDCRGRMGASESVLESVAAALSAVLTCHGREHAVVAMDSIIRRGLLTGDELQRVAARGGTKALRLLAVADGRVESALESVLRYRLLMLGVRVRTQVVIPGLGRVDILVGESLILEADGFEFHSSHGSFGDDRRRDREALRLGFRTVRLTWMDVFQNWDVVLPVLLEILRTRRHRRAADLWRGDFGYSRSI